MPWYTVTKTINGHKYLYLQNRERGKVKTRNQYLGPASGGFGSGPSNLPTPPRRLRARSPEPVQTIPTPPPKREPLYAGEFTIHLQRAKARRWVVHKRKPLQRSLPVDGNFSDPFWDTPSSPSQLRKQAQLYYDEYLVLRGHYNARNVFTRLWSREAREEHHRLNTLRSTLDWYQHKSSSLFDRRLVFTKRRMVIKKSGA